jgi:hypothetical protein
VRLFASLRAKSLTRYSASFDRKLDGQAWVRRQRMTSFQPLMRSLTFFFAHVARGAQGLGPVGSSLMVSRVELSQGLLRDSAEIIVSNTIRSSISGYEDRLFVCSTSALGAFA